MNDERHAIYAEATENFLNTLFMLDPVVWRQDFPAFLSGGIYILHVLPFLFHQLESPHVVLTDLSHFAISSISRMNIVARDTDLNVFITQLSKLQTFMAKQRY